MLWRIRGNDKKNNKLTDSGFKTIGIKIIFSYCYFFLVIKFNFLCISVNKDKLCLTIYYNLYFHNLITYKTIKQNMVKL